MRRIVAVLPLLAAGCADTPTPTTAAPGAAERCGASDCFFQRDVRDFEVVDREHIVVYVGRERCPFLVEVQSLACDVAFAPQLEFFQTALGRVNRLTPIRGGRVCASTRGLVLYAGVAAPALLQHREDVESSYGGRPSVEGFGRTSGYDGSFPIDPASDDVCRVTAVQALQGRPGGRPPRVGSDDLEVLDGDDAEREAEAGGDTSGAAAEPRARDE